MDNLIYTIFGKSDREAFLELYTKAFDSTMSAELFEWKYAKNASGGIAAYEYGKMVAFYGGGARELFVGGTKLSCVQITDTMVEPSKRGIFKKNGIFALTADRFINGYTGEGREYAFCFGFPSARHARLGERLGIYSIADTMKQYMWNLSEDIKKPDPMYTLAETRGDQAQKYVDKLFGSMRESFGGCIVGEKSSEFLRRRYIEHPSYMYGFALFRHRLLGSRACLIVYKEHDRDATIEIMDIIGDKKHVRRALTRFLSYAKEHGFAGAYIWSTPTLAAYFPESDTVSEVCSVCTTVHGLDETYIDSIKNSWVMTGGESDFR